MIIHEADDMEASLAARIRQKGKIGHDTFVAGRADAGALQPDAPVFLDEDEEPTK